MLAPPHSPECAPREVAAARSCGKRRASGASQVQEGRNDKRRLEPRHLLYTAMAGDGLVVLLLLPFTPMLAYVFVKVGWILLVPLALFCWSWLKPHSWFPALLFFGLSAATWLWLLARVQEAVQQIGT